MDVLGDRYVWSSLPFGCKYSPVICLRLISAFAEDAIFKLLVLPFTYLDDVLVARARRDLRRMATRLCSKLTRARYVVSPKLVMEPCTELNFVGEVFDTVRDGKRKKE